MPLLQLQPQRCLLHGSWFKRASKTHRALANSLKSLALIKKITFSKRWAVEGEWALSCWIMRRNQTNANIGAIMGQVFSLPPKAPRHVCGNLQLVKPLQLVFKTLVRLFILVQCILMIVLQVDPTPAPPKRTKIALHSLALIRNIQLAFNLSRKYEWSNSSSHKKIYLNVNDKKDKDYLNDQGARPLAG